MKVKVNLKYVAYYIATENLPSLINNDQTGLTDDEENALDAFCKEVKVEHGSGYWAVPYDCEGFLGIDEVTNLLANVVKVKYVLLDQ